MNTFLSKCMNIAVFLLAFILLLSISLQEVKKFVEVSVLFPFLSFAMMLVDVYPSAIMQILT